MATSVDRRIHTVGQCKMGFVEIAVDQSHCSDREKSSLLGSYSRGPIAGVSRRQRPQFKTWDLVPQIVRIWSEPQEQNQLKMSNLKQAARPVVQEGEEDQVRGWEAALGGLENILTSEYNEKMAWNSGDVAVPHSSSQFHYLTCTTVSRFLRRSLSCFYGERATGRQRERARESKCQPLRVITI